MFNKRRILGTLLVLVMLFVAGTAGFFFHKVQANSTPIKSQNQQLNPIQKLFLVLDVVKKNYVEKPDMDKLLTGAINGMLKSLDDPYTVYLPPQEYENMKEDFSGKYSGIGIVITMKNNQLTVVSPIKGTPGDKAGLKAGDMIMTINSKSTKGMTMKKAVSIMKGKAGTDVTLEIKRKKKETDQNNQSQMKYENLTIDITRAEIEVPYVTSELKEDKIGYIRLSQFIQEVGPKISDRIEKLHKKGTQAFILDLRNNPGGILQQANEVTSNFIAEGKVVSVKDREGHKKTYSVVKKIDAINAPLVILVNKGSASASEIVTGAIQDHTRGVVIGKQTFGKGVVQSVVPFPDGSAVKLTTARYYTPQGRYINHEGIKPDIIVEQNLDTPEDEQLQKAIKVLQQKLK
ncbi:S41 family peptidase [Halanaerocella petrolearia]